MSWKAGTEEPLSVRAADRAWPTEAVAIRSGKLCAGRLKTQLEPGGARGIVAEIPHPTLPRLALHVAYRGRGGIAAESPAQPACVCGAAGRRCGAGAGAPPAGTCPVLRRKQRYRNMGTWGRGKCCRCVETGTEEAFDGNADMRGLYGDR